MVAARVAECAGGGRIRLKQLLFAFLDSLPKSCQHCQLENIFFPSLCLLSYLKKKKKAIWCQIHSWHIIKGSTKNVPENLKQTTAVHMGLNLSILGFQSCSGASEIKRSLYMGGHRPGGMRARFQKCLLSAYYAHGTLRPERLIMNLKDTNPGLLGLFSGRVSPGPWACPVSGSQTARCAQPRAEAATSGRSPRPGRRRFPPGAC